MKYIDEIIASIGAIGVGIGRVPVDRGGYESGGMNDVSALGARSFFRHSLAGKDAVPNRADIEAEMASDAFFRIDRRLAMLFLPGNGLMGCV